MNKKGLSSIVTAVLLILLAVASIAIVWQFVRISLNKSGERINTAISFDCENLNLEILDAKYDDTLIPPQLTTIIKRNAGGGEIVKIKFIVNNGVSDTELPTQVVSDLYEFNTKTFNFIEGQDFNTNEISKGHALKIAPLIKTQSGNEVQCEVKDERVITP